MDARFFAAWMTETAHAVAAARDELTRLDAAIGDADHGTNLDRGFTAVTESPPAAATPREVLTAAGTTLIRKVGGASGPLYGTALRRMGAALPDTPEVSLADLAEALTAGVDGVRRLGGAAEGDKTMVDALAPAARALTEAVRAGASPEAALDAAMSAAEAGAKATVPLRARKGRASYLGERSVGHMDPGAASTSLLLAALRAACGPGSPGAGSGPAGPA
ncbi:dihydroxyacetone kinase subunit DhaL [Sphaerisporangium sp. B11E5]|uniref:dihydroxyacetone kinase subunit DhaL n=1 Tax=Sphaerisporangium sp. B11E5 TaxID=3153563 RepID=UPI00325E16F5